MEFNYGMAKKRFEKEWEKLRKEYEDAGMSEKDIQEIYEFDLDVFRNERIECLHTQPFLNSKASDGHAEGEAMSVLIQKFRVQLSVNDMYHFQADFRFSWIDEIQNDELYLKVVSLPEKDKELLTMIAVDGFLQREIADIRGIAPSAICKKIKKIKKFLNGG